MKKSVLLIINDVILLENTKELLELAGYKVFKAANGKLRFTCARQKLPDIVVCNILIPQFDGFEIYEAFSRSRTTRDIPFIFLSLKAEAEVIRKHINPEADIFFTKPFNETQFLKAIAECLANKAIPNIKKQKPPGFYRKVDNLDELRIFFKEHGEALEVEKNDELFREDWHASYVYLVEEGLIKCFRLDEFGKALITDLSKKDDFLGFYSFKVPGHYPETAEALKKSKLYRISSEEFNHKLLKSQNLTVEFAQLISDNLLIMKTHLLNMAYSSILKKTTNTILEFAESIQGDPQQFIRISRSDLASVAGISKESFIRSLSSLKKEGLIDIVGRDIKILNLQKLHTIR